MLKTISSTGLLLVFNIINPDYSNLLHHLLPIEETITVPPLNQENLLPDVNEEVYIMPANGIFTSGYGWRWERMHNGIDIAGPIGTPIIAAKSGTIITSEWNTGGYGNLVEIEHKDGSITLYAHNDKLLVKAGEKVTQGQLIAEMGSTGYSTGPHLHFEIHVFNPNTNSFTAINPEEKLNIY